MPGWNLALGKCESARTRGGARGPRVGNCSRRLALNCERERERAAGEKSSDGQRCPRYIYKQKRRARPRLLGASRASSSLPFVPRLPPLGPRHRPPTRAEIGRAQRCDGCLNQGQPLLLRTGNAEGSRRPYRPSRGRHELA
jgi:hypothetical protein